MYEGSGKVCSRKGERELIGRVRRLLGGDSLTKDATALFRQIR